MSKERCFVIGIKPERNDVTAVNCSAMEECRKDDEHFVATVKVAVSKQFLSWVMALGNQAKIVGPDNVVNQVKAEIDRLKNLYDN